MQYVTQLFAQAYDACSYGASSYGSNTCAASTSTGNSTGSGGVLTNTGFDIAVVVTIACVICLITILVRFWKRPIAEKDSEA